MFELLKDEIDNFIYAGGAIALIGLACMIPKDSPAAAMAHALFGAFLIKVKGGTK